jgi:hypothetical protein
MWRSRWSVLLRSERCDIHPGSYNLNYEEQRACKTKHGSEGGGRAAGGGHVFVCLFLPRLLAGGSLRTNTRTEIEHDLP